MRACGGIGRAGHLPQPQQILEIQPITWLLDHGTVVICVGTAGTNITTHPPT